MTRLRFAPHGGPYGQLSLTAFAPGQKEVCHIGACDQKHKAHGSHQDPHRCPHVAHIKVGDGHEFGRRGPLILCFTDGLSDPRQIDLRLFDTHAREETTDGSSSGGASARVPREPLREVAHG